jgi:hypothetical protein
MILFLCYPCTGEFEALKEALGDTAAAAAGAGGAVAANGRDVVPALLSKIAMLQVQRRQRPGMHPVLLHGGQPAICLL